MLMGGRLGDQTPSPASLPLLGYRGESRNGRGLSRNGGNDPLGADSSKSIGATLLEPRAAIRMGQCARPPSPAGRPRVSALRDGEQEDVQGETLRRETLLAVEWFRSVLLELARCWRTDDTRNSPKRANLFAFALIPSVLRRNEKVITPPHFLQDALHDSLDRQKVHIGIAAPKNILPIQPNISFD